MVIRRHPHHLHVHRALDDVHKCTKIAAQKERPCCIEQTHQSA